MAAPGLNDDIWDEAMALLLAWQNAPEDKDAIAAIRRFCAQGPDHRDAWDEARRVFRLTGTAVGATKAARAPRRRAHVSRRKVLAGLGVVAVGTAALKGPDLWQRLQSDAATGVAEIRHQTLPDGSAMTIGPTSMVAIAFTAQSRAMRLLDGMACCEVAKDPSRPFEITAGHVRLTTSDAAFEIQDNGERLFAGVERGQIQVAFNDGTPSGAMTLNAGDWIALDSGTSGFRRGTRDPAQTALWRQNLLVADQEQIRSVVAEINRWHPGRILIPQPSLASASVSGLFDLSDPAAALAAVIGPYGGKVIQLSRWLTILTSL